jgi:hypothetical protein
MSKPARQKKNAAGVTGRFNPNLTPLLVSVDVLREDPDNANQHGERSIEDIAASFREFGQQKPLIYKAGGTVVAGNGGLRAAIKLGWTHVAAIQFDGPSEHARAYAIADNRAAEHSQRDDEAVGRQLRDLAAAWDDFRPEMVGYTVNEADQLPGGYSGAPLSGEGSEAPDGENAEGEGAEEAAEAFPEFGEDIAFDYQCPKCSHVWSGKAK